ncbi:MAG TPA: hypothetical protein VKC34_12245 [Blastocatellia bacterium]|nr:hypothetical protein [Blastocatellia bacterium]
MLDEYTSGYIEFNTGQMSEYYLYLSGQKADLELAPIYDRYGDLFSRDAIAALKQKLSECPEHFETERAALKHLLSFAIDHFLENSVKELTESISQYEAAATIEWKGERLTFQDSTVALRTEADRDLRRDLFKRRAAIIDSSNVLRAERFSKLYEAARSLGFSSYTSLYEEMRQLDFSEIARESETFLARTEATYIAALDEALKREMGLRIDEAERADAHHFLHLSAYDDRFPAERLLRVYEETMAGLGIRVGSQKNIFIDSEPRPRKSARAFCTLISVPDDIRLVIRLSGGHSDYGALFHEAGHAQHYAGVSPSLRPEFRYSGDYALTETYAFLFDHLLAEPGWLTGMLKFRDNRGFIRSAILTRLVTIRRYAAKVVYEHDLHSSEDLARAGSVYSRLQTEATKFRTEETDFLFDVDEGFYAANYLRAWALEVALREHLKIRFGDHWWTSKRAGNFLREIWETGDRYNAQEMAGQIGLGPITTDLLVEEFNQKLR